MKTLKSLIVLMAAILSVAAVAHANPIPLGSITNSIDEPSHVALDAQGNVYISEPARNLVIKFNSKGEKLGTISVPRPYGIAVNSTGSIYVSSVQVPQLSNQYVNKSAVYIYSSQLIKTGSLGSGEGEFNTPVDLDLDSDGNVYVVDMATNQVRVFSSSGGNVATFGGYGNSPGKLNKPMGIAINNAAGLIYIVDRPDYTDANGTTFGARIQVFDKNGVAQNAFGQFGIAIGQITSPVDIAVDNAGILYVSDTYQNVVHVLSASDGTPIGEGGIYASLATRPAGVAVSRNSIAYVAWQSTASGKGRIDIFGLDGYVIMEAAPASLAFEARQYGVTPSAKTVVVANAGSGTLNWTVTKDRDWITLGQPAPVGPASSAGLAVGVDASKLTSGSYQGTISITADFGEKIDISVSLTVYPPLVLNISNWSPAFTLKKGSSSASQTVFISIEGGAGNWNLSPANLPVWLSVSPTSGQAGPTPVTFTANASGLEVRDEPYLAYVPVSAAGAIGDGSNITVSLKINATTKISVTTNNDAAVFMVSGPETYTGKGKAWSVENAPAGEYTVTFGAVTGYKKPFAQTKTLADNGSVSFSGAYLSFKDLAAKKNIVVAQGPGPENDSRIKVYKNTGAPVAFDLVALETRYGADVAAGDVDGDGAAELIVGAGMGANNPAIVRIYRAADKALLLEFIPFGSLNGVQVASGDLDGDGKAEVIVADNNGTFSVYAFTDGKMTPTGIEGKAGMITAVVDTEGDGRPEIISASGSSVTTWKVDTMPGLGNWTAAEVSSLALPASSLSGGDIDADGTEEIIIGRNGAASAPSIVTIVRANGRKKTFATFDKYGIAVASADLDGDGKAEIIAGAGAASGTSDGKTKADKMEKRREGNDQQGGNKDHEIGTVRVYGGDGTLKYVIRSFDEAKAGVNVAVGDLGL